MPPRNDWNEYKKLILFEMKETRKSIEGIKTIVTDLSKDVSGLKVKAAIAGGMAGLVGTGIVSAVIALWK